MYKNKTKFGYSFVLYDGRECLCMQALRCKAVDEQGHRAWLLPWIFDGSRVVIVWGNLKEKPKKTKTKKITSHYKLRVQCSAVKKYFGVNVKNEWGVRCEEWGDEEGWEGWKAATLPWKPNIYPEHNKRHEFLNASHQFPDDRTHDNFLSSFRVIYLLLEGLYWSVWYDLVYISSFTHFFPSLESASWMEGSEESMMHEVLGVR